MTETTTFSSLIVKPIYVLMEDTTSVSEIAYVSGTTIKTIIVPSGFVGSKLTFQISHNGINFYNYYNINNTILEITCSENRAYGLGANDFYSIPFLKIIANNPQTSNINFILICRGI